MIIRQAMPNDAEQLKCLYFEHLTSLPPTEEQNMQNWQAIIQHFYDDDYTKLLVCEVNGEVVSSVHVTVIRNLTHNLRPYAVIENVVTHSDHRCKGYASALLAEATAFAKQHNCYKVFLETGSNKESTLNFYKNNGFAIDVKHSCLKRL